MRLNQTSLTIDAALAGQGIALAARFLVADDIAAGRLVQVHDGALNGQRDFYLLSRLSPARGKAVEVVMSWILSRG